MVDLPINVANLRAIWPEDVWYANDINQYLVTYPTSYLYQNGYQLTRVFETSQHELSFAWSENGLLLEAVEDTAIDQDVGSDLHSAVRPAFDDYGNLTGATINGLLPYDAVQQWNYPLSGDSADASQGYQFMMLHDMVCQYDGRGRLVQIWEGVANEWTRAISFGYAPADARPVTVTVEVSESGTVADGTSILQSADIAYAYADYTPSSVALTGTIVAPKWAAATVGYNVNIDMVNDAALIDQFFLPHNVTYDEVSGTDHRLALVNEDSGQRVTSITYGDIDGIPFTLERTTIQQDGSSLETIVDFERFKPSYQLSKLIYDEQMVGAGELY